MAFNKRRVADRASPAGRAKSKPYRLDKRKPVLPSPPFTAESVTRDISNALRGGKNMRSIGSVPDIKVIERLTSALNRLHSIYFVAQEERKKAEDVPSAKDLFFKLRKILPEIEEHGRAEAAYAPKFYIASVERCAEAVRNLLTNSPVGEALHAQALPNQARGWQWCAESICRILKGEIGISPMARFMAAVAPTLTGENPKPGAVKVWLLGNCR